MQETSRRKRALFKIAAATVVLALPALALADRSFYRGKVELQAEGGGLVATHRHDWAAHRSTLRVTEKEGGRVLFERDVPALTSLWVAPDGHHIVGLSNIRYLNPYQLVVYTASGKQLLAEDMTNYDWARRTASVTNYINWYKEPNPAIALVVQGGRGTLTVEDAQGIQRSFAFDALAGAPLAASP